MSDTRADKAEIIARSKSIRRINDHLYKVKSQSGNSKYNVISTELGYSCSCPDHTFRRVKCKHIQAVVIEIDECADCKSKEVSDITNLAISSDINANSVVI